MKIRYLFIILIIILFALALAGCNGTTDQDINMQIIDAYYNIENIEDFNSNQINAVVKLKNIGGKGSFHLLFYKSIETSDGKELVKIAESKTYTAEEDYENTLNITLTIEDNLLAFDEVRVYSKSVGFTDTYNNVDSY